MYTIVGSMDFTSIVSDACRLVLTLQQSSPPNLTLVNYLYHHNKYCTVLHDTLLLMMSKLIVLLSTVA